MGCGGELRLELRIGCLYIRGLGGEGGGLSGMDGEELILVDRLIACVGSVLRLRLVLG